jgi:DNA invertase Pin-like site-specific DNA recombinase
MTASVDQRKVDASAERLAFVYVRQSSPRQVHSQRKSPRLQYAFAEQAAALGWTGERVIVLDEDQGTSAALPQACRGFGDMVAAVARSELGIIVMSFELSRRSRNDLNWHQLVYLCRPTGMLMADEQGRCDPSSSSDQMVLGIRGQASERERDSLVHRMVEARGCRNAAVGTQARFGHSSSPRAAW